MKRNFTWNESNNYWEIMWNWCNEFKIVNRNEIMKMKM